MLRQLQPNDYHKVMKLIVNTNHELSVEAVVRGKSPGEIYVDDADKPQSALIITPECSVDAGYANHPLFNAGVKQRLDFYEDPVTCDTEEWERRIADIHSNMAVRKYTRRYYQLNKFVRSNFMEFLDDHYTVEYVYADNLNDLQYENAEEVANWFVFAVTSVVLLVLNHRTNGLLDI